MPVCFSDGHPERPEKKNKKQKSKQPDIHATDLQRRDKEIQHIKYEELRQTSLV